MSTTTTTDILTGLAGYLASNALAQYRPEQSGYLDHPDLPAILFASADTPDHCMVATVTGYDPIVRTWDVTLAFRAVGASAVEHLADGVFDHFDAVMGEAARTWVAGTVVAMPSLTWDDLEVIEVTRIARGTIELTSESKHKGSRS
ncbi:hypothetical protein, partial [Mycobacterium kubicae]|uniref:hypothetical protein n=1 Tax=Mycobacterium kubicae TaxID=120959 RepID=UPI0010423435